MLWVQTLTGCKASRAEKLSRLRSLVLMVELKHAQATKSIKYKYIYIHLYLYIYIYIYIFKVCCLSASPLSPIVLLRR